MAIAVAAASKLLMVQTSPVGMGLATTADVITAMAVVIIWGISFIGITKYMKAYSTQYDSGFYMLFSIFVSLAVAIAAATASRFLIVQTAPAEMGSYHCQYHDGISSAGNLGHILRRHNQVPKIPFSPI